MSNHKRPAPCTILGREDPSAVVVREQRSRSRPDGMPETFEPIKPTPFQVLIGSVGSGIWMWWTAWSWALVLTCTIGGYFEGPFWVWLALALLSVGFRCILETWSAKVQGITEDDYDPSKYPWWGRKIRLRRPLREL